MMKIWQKIKNSRVAKSAACGLVACSVAAMSAISCFAEDATTTTGSADVQAALSDSFNTMSSDILNYVLIALPIVLGIVALFFGIKKAIKFFTSVANKG